MQREVSAFGPKHAEQARRFNQSKGGYQQYAQVLVLPYRPNHGPIQNSYEHTQGGGFFSRELIFDLKKPPTQYTYKSDGPIQFIAASEPLEIVLKVANISSRSGKKQLKKPKAVSSFIDKAYYETVDVCATKSIDFLDDEDEIDLSNAPIFQMLCEMSKMW